MAGIAKQFHPNQQLNLVNGMNGLKLTELNNQTILTSGQHNSHSAFHFQPYSNYYAIVNTRTGSALDVAEASLQSGHRVVFWGLHGNDNQLWQFITTDKPDHYLIKAKHSGLYLSVQNDTLVQTSFVPNAMYQIWHITQALRVSGLVYIPNQQYYIKSASTGENVVIENGRALVKNAKDFFQLHETFDDYYYLYSVSANFMLDVERASLEDGAECCVFKTHSNANQQFKLVDTNVPNQYLIQAKHSDKYLTAHNGKLCQFGYTGQPNQLWFVSF
jgi:hypothetical protein